VSAPIVDGNNAVPEQEQYEEYDRPRGTWQDSGYKMSDSEAHRDVRYHIRSPLQQLISVFMSQMSLFSKRKSIYVILIMAVLIPLIYIAIKDDFSAGILSDNTGNGALGLMLCMLPFILALFTSFLCGRVMPTEFVDRSAYMNMALPLSRSTFALGKYLAALVVTYGVFVFAYGMGLFTATMDYSNFAEDTLGSSFLMLTLAVLVYSSFAFSLGCILKRGATIISLITMVFILPSIQLYLRFDNRISASDLTLMPNLLPDIACISLGSMFTGSPVGFTNMILSITIDVSELNMVLITAISLIWTIGFLILGMLAINRREM
jgi:ABC-type transport system involved in multi-copper enzyme maturation permease subunit